MTMWIVLIAMCESILTTYGAQGNQSAAPVVICVVGTLIGVFGCMFHEYMLEKRISELERERKN